MKQMRTLAIKICIERRIKKLKSFEKGRTLCSTLFILFNKYNAWREIFYSN